VHTSIFDHIMSHILHCIAGIHMEEKSIVVSIDSSGNMCIWDALYRVCLASISCSTSQGQIEGNNHV
jgi:hypothetical protein